MSAGAGLAAIAAADTRALLIGAGVVAGAALLGYLVLRNSGGIAAFAAKSTVDAGAGLVLGVGDAVGVPRTDNSACERALADGRMWDASFACPAVRFVRGLFSQDNAGPAPIAPPGTSSPYNINPRDRT